MNRESVIEWASGWVEDEPPGQRGRFADALRAELANWREPAPEPVFCKHCPFAKHVHYEEGGKLVTPSCSGFEPMDGDR